MGRVRQSDAYIEPETISKPFIDSRIRVCLRKIWGKEIRGAVLEFGDMFAELPASARKALPPSLNVRALYGRFLRDVDHTWKRQRSMKCVLGAFQFDEISGFRISTFGFVLQWKYQIDCASAKLVVSKPTVVKISQIHVTNTLVSGGIAR